MGLVIMLLVSDEELAVLIDAVDSAPRHESTEYCNLRVDLMQARFGNREQKIYPKKRKSNA
jgi:hypothetical protein